MTRGFTDRASQVDNFNIMGYVNGLSKFVMDCNTPMTIGIQGDWGTGKTSIMNMIRNSLEKDQRAEMIWFNTWQFSQFNMGNDLALSLLSTLLHEMDADDDKKKNILNFIGHVGKVAKNMTVMMVESKIGGEAAEVVKSALTNEEQFDLPKAIRELKNQFEKLVEQTLQRKRKDRFIIFVDDLDRLQPGKAVELLEVLKLFLDCEQCVFILAIDYQVVLRGVAEKYGATMSEDKGKSFFDKIIQVPFKMPIAHYDISNFVEKCFKEIGIEINNEEDLTTYVSLIQKTIGQNPRSMKRLFNAFLLLTCITTEEVFKEEKNKQILFAILCLQQANDVMYDYIVQGRHNIEEMWPKITNHEDEDIKSYMSEHKLDEKKQKQFFEFMDIFSKLIDTNKNNELDKKEIEVFQAVLDFSSITSAESIEEPKRHVRQELDSLEDLVDKTGTIKEIVDVYQEYNQRIHELVGEDLKEKYFAGQSSVSFYMKTKSGKQRKFCEIKLNKTALTVFFTYKTDQMIIDKINQIVSGVHNRLNDPSTQINGITNLDKIDEIFELIKFTYNYVYEG